MAQELSKIPIRTPRRALAGLLLSIPVLFACHHHDDGGGGATTPGATSPLVQLRVIPSSAAPGQPVEFSAAVTGADPAAIVRWTYSDGSQLVGESVSRSFDEPGLEALTAELIVGGTALLELPATVAVFDPSTGTLPEFGELPPVPGDVDQDGMLSLADARLLAEAIDELGTTLSEAAFAAADADLSGILDDRDLEIVSSLVLGQGDAAALVPSSGVPGTLVELHSAHLDVLGRAVEVRVGDRRLFPDQFVPGRVGFLIPFDLDQAGSFAVRPGPRTVELVVDGAQVDSFGFEVLGYGPLPENPAADFAELLALEGAALDELVEATDDLLALTPPVGADERLVAVELLRSVAVESRSAGAALTAQLASLDPALEPLLARAMVASGAMDALEELRSAVAPGIDRGASSSLDTLCRNERLLNAWVLTNQASQATCAAMVAASVGSAFIPGVGLATAVGGLLATIQIWTPTLTLGTVGELVLSVLPRVQEDIALEIVGGVPLADGDTVEVVPYLTVNRRAQFCAAIGGAGSGMFLEAILQRALRKMLTRGPFAPIASLARLGFTATFDRIVAGIATSAGNVLALTPLGDLITNLWQQLCNWAIDGEQIEIEPAGVLAGPDPFVGQLFVPPSGSGERATYTFFPDPQVLVPPEGVRVTASAGFCARSLSGEVFIPIGEVDITITMGDNGNLTDDIFEVFVDGVSVLTTSVPVTSTSRIYPIALGDHTLSMAGRAAPDGVGTYFISVQGGDLLNGPPTSGIDLVPGVVHTWTLRVEGGN